MFHKWTNQQATPKQKQRKSETNRSLTNIRNIAFTCIHSCAPIRWLSLFRQHSANCAMFFARSRTVDCQPTCEFFSMPKFETGECKREEEKQKWKATHNLDKQLAKNISSKQYAFSSKHSGDFTAGVTFHIVVEFIFVCFSILLSLSLTLSNSFSLCVHRENKNTLNCLLQKRFFHW